MLRLKPSERMTVEWIREALTEIAKFATTERDPEAAHAAEDVLWETVLLAIAEDRCDDPEACALAALQTKLFDFPRWCA